LPGVRSLPRLLLAAYICIGIAVLITLVGIGLELLPEEFSVEWNGLPLSEYDLGNVTGGIVVFGLAGALLAGLHLRRDETASPRRRRVAKVLLVVGLVPLVVVAALVAFILALCSGGGCS
jgi:hypothetical protein